jgi:hypothetical protein
MQNHLHGLILTAAVLAARVASQAANVYSLNGLSADSFLLAPHRPDEIKLTSYGYQAGPQSSFVEWYVSTNALARQPRWDGLSAEAPLSVRKACVLALPSVREHFPEVRSWSVKSLTLCHPYPGDAYPDVWYYEITFTPRDPESRSRIERQASFCATQQIVLLDGTVVPLTILKKK